MRYVIRRIIPVISILLIIGICLNGCYSPSEDLLSQINAVEYGSRESGSEESVSTVPASFDPDDDDLNVNWGYGCKLDGIIYTINYLEVYFVEGNELKKICRDPLCNHADVHCPSSKVITAQLVVTDGENLFCFGNYFDRNPKYDEAIEAGRIPDCEEYAYYNCIFKIDPRNQVLRVMTKWISSGSNIPFLRTHGDYVYFLMVDKSFKSTLCRVKKNASGIEKVFPSENNSVTNVAFGDDFVLYRQGDSIYRADANFKNAELFLDRITSFITVKDDYIYYAVYYQKDYPCKGRQTSVRLHSADLYRIPCKDWRDLTQAEKLLSGISPADDFAITDNEIIYRSWDPVSLGEGTSNGENIDYFNGKVMKLDLKTMGKSIVCSDFPKTVSESRLTYADERMSVFDSYDETFTLDNTTGQLIRMKREK